MISDKCNPLIWGNKAKQMRAQIGEHKRWETRSVKLLGMTIGNDFYNFKHLSNICMKTSRELTALTRVKEYLGTDYTRVMLKVFFKP